MQISDTSQPALDRARRKAYWRLLPLLFVCYVIAYADRSNVAIAKLTMCRDLPAFDNAVIGFGAGLFFWGYFLLEIPGALMVEKWSARKTIFRIMVIWGFMAALTAVVKTPAQFYVVRFLLGLAEAGFFPGVIIYLTHWFPARDRGRALSLFLIATPIAQITSPKISNALLKIGTDEVVNGMVVQHPALLGLAGWQWVYLFWGVPAVVLGVIVLFGLTDRPVEARWLTPDEKEALEGQLDLERTLRAGQRRMTFAEGFRNPKVLLLALAYFCSTAANYGMEFFLPSILESWYGFKLNTITWLVMLPPCLALGAQLFVGWNSDRTKERRLHAVGCISIGLIALALTPLTKGHLVMTIACFMLTYAGIKGYQPAFWALPSLFLTSTAAATSVGLINSVGNLGGSAGPSVVGKLEQMTGSFAWGIYFLVTCMIANAIIILALGIGRKEPETPGN